MIRRIGSTALLVTALLPTGLAAQYFGKNKVQYTSFEFKIIQTEHFDVYFYEREREAALDAARMAERSYARLSRVLGHTFKERKPIILYASHADFQQTNALPGDINEATGGVTDFLKHRAVIPFTGSFAEFDHVLTHEMVHQFQYDIWSRGKAGAGIATLIAINPPLWFAEGMAEYLSLGGIGAETATWLRDAAVEGELPTIQQLNTDPYIFPYRFGQAIMAYIGQRWGDEAIGALMQTTLTGGIEGAFRRVLGISTAQLSDQWRDHVQQTYLPELGERQKARVAAHAVLTEPNSGGRLHVAPALSPDGSKIAYLSERDFYFVDLYLADGRTGKVIRRLVKSTFNADYETFRYISASSSWSPDGRVLALAAKRGPKDDIVLLNDKGDEVGRITVQLNGVTHPAWSPDGQRLVFSGYDGGISDLYIVNRDGSGLQRLTNDKFADLQPDWSPDGTRIAFVTDRGPATNFADLRFGNLRIATYDLATGTIQVLPHMDAGKNISPQFGPDGRSIALVSDRTGISNIFLYDLDSAELFQLTNFYTGAQSVTSDSPVLSWAREADRLAFVYFENQSNDVYTLENPRSLMGSPYVAPSKADSALTNFAVTQGQPAPGRPNLARVEPDQRDSAAAQGDQPQVLEGGSIYRTAKGFRSAGQVNPELDSLTPEMRPVSIEQLLDSARLALPDTTSFAVEKYKPKLTPEYVARPSIGYTRDNFGNGFFGGSAIVLGDMLGNHQLLLSAALNGRLKEATVFAAYANLSRRINWAVGAGQEPYFYREVDSIAVGDPSPTENTLITRVRRLIVRQAFGEAYYPFNRFQRAELGLRLVNVNDAILNFNEPYDNASGIRTAEPYLTEDGLGSFYYAQPSLALAFDNTLFGYIGPFYGKRYRFEISQAVGSWRYTQGLADYRRYDGIVGPLVLASRLLYYGQFGRDAGRFRVFLGSTELVRGHTSGSYFRNECVNPTQTCNEINRLVGNQLLVGSTELRFPILSPNYSWVPLGVPPLEGALFGDVGVIWDQNSTLRFSRRPNDDPDDVRTPVGTVGLSLRTNLFGIMILRGDWNFPLGRNIGDYWTISFGPSF